jgi:hypothetical protein
MQEEGGASKGLKGCVVVRGKIGITAHGIIKKKNVWLISKKSPDRYRGYILTNPIKIKTN